MMTKEQINDLSSYYQMDSFSIMREYIQLIFLRCLYQERQASKVYFKGGTALRLLYGSSRFSEDLDFSTIYKKKQVDLLLNKILNTMKYDVSSVSLSLLYEGDAEFRLRLKHESASFKYPFVIRLDFHTIKKPTNIVQTGLITRFPISIFPILSHLSGSEILAEKIRALITRMKGRDFYDAWYLLEKGIEIDLSLVKDKLKEVNKTFNKRVLLQRIQEFSQRKLDQDLAQFLPKTQRKITGLLKGNLIKSLSKVVPG